MSIMIEEDNNNHNSILPIVLPDCSKCVSGNVCKYRDTYDDLMNAVNSVIVKDFNEKTPPCKITITCKEFRADQLAYVFSKNTQDNLQQYQSDTLPLDKSIKTTTTPCIVPSQSEESKIETDDESHKREKNEKALESIDYLTQQIENSNTEINQPASISTAEKNYKPVILYGRIIEYKEAIDLVKRGILLDHSPDPDHPVFVVK